MGIKDLRLSWYGFAVDITPDELLDELSAITARLEELPPESPERSRLELQRDNLRETARRTADAARNLDSLRTELVHLRRRLAAFEADKVEVPDWQVALTRGGRFSLTDPVADAARINDAMDAATALDRASIEARIADLEETLGA